VLDLTPPIPPMPPPSRFVREETIAAGAVASISRARDLVGGRMVTLVEVLPEPAADGFFLARFAREARLLAAIDHPNVVRVVASGIEQGVPFVATELVPGQTLAELVRTRGSFTAGEVVGWARQILAGLGAIHSAGLLHLRLTPRTILVGDDGVVRITDVGVASLGDAEERTERREGVEVARYLAPELIEGGDVSEATDLYAVGTILFEALTGRPPFPGDNPVLVRFAQVQALPPVPSQVVTSGVPPELDAAVLRALAKDPTRRYADAQAMAAALPPAQTANGVDRLISQTAAVREIAPRRTVAALPPAGAWPGDPVRTDRVDRSGRRRQASGGWVWPIALACVAIGLLIGALAVSLSGDAPADEAAVGVSVATRDASQPTVTTPARQAQSPTARVVRSAGEAGAAAPTGNAFRAPASASKTPRSIKTPTPSE
jgi:serine/threonine-protein kinase